MTGGMNSHMESSSLRALQIAFIRDARPCSLQRPCPDALSCRWLGLPNCLEPNPACGIGGDCGSIQHGGLFPGVGSGSGHRPQRTLTCTYTCSYMPIPNVNNTVVLLCCCVPDMGPSRECVVVHSGTDTTASHTTPAQSTRLISATIHTTGYTARDTPFSDRCGMAPRKQLLSRRLPGSARLPPTAS